MNEAIIIARRQRRLREEAERAKINGGRQVFDSYPEKQRAEFTFRRWKGNPVPKDFIPPEVHQAEPAPDTRKVAKRLARWQREYMAEEQICLLYLALAQARAKEQRVLVFYDPEAAARIIHNEIEFILKRIDAWEGKKDD